MQGFLETREGCGVWAVVFVAFAAGAAQQDGSNLLKNGSFEGGKRYWFCETNAEAVRGDAVQARTLLRRHARHASTAAGRGFWPPA